MTYSLYLPAAPRECNFSIISAASVMKSTYLGLASYLRFPATVLKNCILLSLIVVAGCGRPVSKPEAQQEQQAPVQNQAQPAGEAAAGLSPRPSPMGTEMAAPPAEPARIPGGTSVRVRLRSTIDTGRNRAGDGFSATLDKPVSRDGRVLLPKGTVFHGHLTESKSSGRLRGRAMLALTLDSFDLNGRSYEVGTSSIVRASEDHKRRNIGLIGGGSGIGAAIGAIAGGAKGALIGAGAGAAAGTAGAAATGKRNIRLPVETPLTFTLRRSVDL